MEKKSDVNFQADISSCMRWAHSMCETIDQLEMMSFPKDSIGQRFQERCVYAAKVFRDLQKENDYPEGLNNAVILQKASPDFKRGFIFSMRCIIDMVSNKPETYTKSELLDFLHNFILINRSFENIEM